MNDSYIKERLQAIKGIASEGCADIKDADNISSFCDEIYSAIPKIGKVAEELKETKSIDLIRREDVLKLINQFVFGVTKEQVHESKKTFIKYIEKIPTAYSIDKVVEELEEAKHEVCLSDDDLEYYQNGIDEAIEIVKQGGVADDVCVWKKSKDYPFDWLVGCDGCEVNHRQGDYCPRCGKKIKVVE